MSDTPVPTVGRIVHFTLTEWQALDINRRRADAAALGAQKTGAVVHTGNEAKAGQVYPMVITRVWGDRPDSPVNGQVLLDGNDALWVTSAAHGEGQGRFTWPGRA